MFLTRVAGTLCRSNLSYSTTCEALLAINEDRYGHGKHPAGPLSLAEMQATVFKGLERWLPRTSGTEATTPRIRKLRDLMSGPAPETRWIIKDLLSEGLTLLAGKPKAGKSWLALALQLGCALGSQQGGLLLGRYPVEPLDVFYLSLEDTEARFYSRVNKLLAGRPLPENFDFALDWKPLLAGGIVELDAHLTCHAQTRLVVIDTLARVRAASSGNGSMYQEDYALMGELQELAKFHHIALVLVHHLRKMGSEDTFDEISGSTAMTGATDTNLVLKRERNQNSGVLHVTGREVEEQELAMDFQPTTGHWLCAGKAADREVSQGKQQILDLLREKEEMTPAQIAQALERPVVTIRKQLSRMAAEKLVEKNFHGHYLCLNNQPELSLGWEDQAAD